MHQIYISLHPIAYYQANLSQIRALFVDTALLGFYVAGPDDKKIISTTRINDRKVVSKATARLYRRLSEESKSMKVYPSLERLIDNLKRGL